MHKLQTPNSKLQRKDPTFHVSRRKGSALILTLLIIGLIASLGFYIGRSAVREGRIVNTTEAALGAYYAAEAGLEDGLARLAADRNIELPKCVFGTSGASCVANTNLTVADLAISLPLSFPDRIRLARFGPRGGLTSNQVDAASLNVRVVERGNGEVKPADNPQDFFYDLKITSKSPQFGNVSGGNPPDPANPCVGNPCNSSDTKTLVKNGNTKEFSFDPGAADYVAPGSMHIFWKCNGGLCNAGTYYLAVTIIRQCPAGTPGNVECTNDIILRSDSANDPSTEVEPFENATNNIVKVRVKPVSTDPNFLGANMSVVFWDAFNSAAVLMRGDIARVQSIGYFGGISRRLEADVDRNSGALLGLFDYAVYAGSTFSQPQ